MTATSHIRRVSFAYIVQLNMPGTPIKIGHSSRPRCRWGAFIAGTPCETRMIGITLNGRERELEMLAATEGAKIHGEWRMPTAELADLVASYHARGEWFEAVDDPQAHFVAAGVAERAMTALPGCEKWGVRYEAHKYHWASTVLKAAQESDPLLGVDWAGFTRKASAPSLEWPRLRAAA